MKSEYSEISGHSSLFSLVFKIYCEFLTLYSSIGTLIPEVQMLNKNKVQIQTISLFLI
jgi:hypothetical protein